MNKRPNILLVISDQHNAGVAGFAGDTVVRTPHLDALAQRSLQFDNAFCASPCCTPSRMCLLTGKDVHHCSAWSNHWVIFPEHTTWPAHFAAHGYKTGLVGKMNFGGKNQMQGFGSRPYGDLRHGMGHQPDPIDLYPAYHGATNAGISEIPESLISDNVITREALSWVLEQADADPDAPWFCCVTYSRPHAPYTSPGRYIRRYRGQVAPVELQEGFKERLDPFSRLHYDAEPGRDLSAGESLRAREAYYANVDFVDDCIGELLDGAGKAGVLDNTIVIYTSDHGDMIGEHGLWGKGVAFDESIRVPLLIAGPGVAAGHHRLAQPVSLIDLFPTACSLAGIAIPPGLDGVDLAPLLRDPSASTRPRSFAFSTYFADGVRAAGAWRLPEGAKVTAMRAVCDENWKYVANEGGEPLLFDRVNDPGETVNLAAAPQHAERRRLMEEALFAGFKWGEARLQLAADRERVPEFASGVKASTPYQYMLPDGRIFDAEGALYDARWLPLPPVHGGGIIPQQFG